MPMMDPKRALLLVIDVQSKLMPAIRDGDIVIRTVKRLVEAATLLDVPRLFTEQYPKGLGPTVADIPLGTDRPLEKLCFDACGLDGFLDRIPADAQVVVTGSEAHVCVLQTVLSLRAASRQTYVVRDGIGSRTLESEEVAVRRMARHGAEIVTSEMVVFEWLQTAENPHFRTLSKLIK